MNDDFDSEFMEFLNQFLVEHPDVAKDQKHEWDHLWSPLHDKVAMAEVQEGALNDGVSVTIQ
jgi:hypothetical protein